MSAEKKEDGVEERFAEVVRKYARAVQDAARDLQRRQWEAAREYGRAVQELLPEFGGEQTARSYPHVVQDRQKRWQDATRAYHESLQKAGEDAERRHEKAFRGYVAGLKEAWATVDPSAIDAATVVAIGQAVAAAACGADA